MGQKSGVRNSVGNDYVHRCFVLNVYVPIAFHDYKNAHTGQGSRKLTRAICVRAQVDVTGKCPSEYHVQNKGWYSTTVKRSKDLLACTDRHDYQSALQASPYNVHSVSVTLSSGLLSSSASVTSCDLRG